MGRFITKNHKPVYIKTPILRADPVDTALKLLANNHPLSTAIQLANTDWDRIASLLADGITNPEKFLKEIKEDKNIQSLRALLDLLGQRRKSRREGY